MGSWWGRLSRLRRYTLVSVILAVAVLISLGGLLWSGISAALDARQAYRDLEVELSNLAPVDLIRADTYQSLEARFSKAEGSSQRARSRLAFLKALTRVPVVGVRIKEARILLDCRTSAIMGHIWEVENPRV